MDEHALAPLAKVLVGGYAATRSYSSDFKHEYSSPPTEHAKVHHLRSVVIAKLQRHDRYIVHPEWTEFGRVQVTDTELGESFLLRSARMVDIEAAKAQGVLFDPSDYIKANTNLLVYSFAQDDLTLSVVGAAQPRSGGRPLALGHPVEVGRWLYSDFDDIPTFPVDDDDDFRDVGNHALDDDAEEGDGEG